MNSGVKRLHPPVDRHVVDLDAALGEQLLDVAVGQRVAQIPAHRDLDHLAGESVVSGTRRRRNSHPQSLSALAQSHNAVPPGAVGAKLGHLE